MSAVQIGLFGKPALFVGDQLHLFGGARKAIALLAYLSLHRDRSLSRAAIAYDAVKPIRNGRPSNARCV